MPRVGARGPRGYKKLASARAYAERERLAGRTVGARTKDLQPDGMIRKGGARPGAGRPRGVPWDYVRTLVERTGASLEEVIAQPSIPTSCLEDPAIITRLKDVVDRAQLVFRVKVRESLARKGVDKLSVTALLGIARNTAGMEFDKQSIQAAGAPDVVGLEQKIDELLTRLSKRKARADARPSLDAVGSTSEPVSNPGSDERAS